MNWVTGWDNGGAAAGVSTFNGRFGVVTAELGDYIAGQITDGVSTLGGATVLESLDNAKTAIDAVSARSPVVTSGSTAIATGVGFVMWSYTVAEGAAVTACLRITARAITGPAVMHSIALVTFGASRDIAGVPALTVQAESEDGTIPVGSIATAVNGNDVEITLTYAYTGTLDWIIHEELNEIAP